MAGKVRIVRGDVWAERLREHLLQSSLDATEWMESHTRVQKRDADSLSGLLWLDDRLGFLKLYQAHSLRRRLQYRLRMGRPLRNYKMAQTLLDKGIAVPQPLAGLLVEQGMLVLTEGLEQGGTLAALWRDGIAGTEAAAAMRSAGEALGMLHRSGYTYGDCGWNNFYWDGRRVNLIDLDRTRKSRARGIEQLRDLARFTVTAEAENVESSTFEQFLQAYVAGVGDSRRDVVDRMLPTLYRFRMIILSKYGKRLL